MSPSDIIDGRYFIFSFKITVNYFIFLNIYLITQDKNSISALEIKRKLGVSYNAAWRIKHKLMQVMKEHDNNRKLGNIVQLEVNKKESVDVVTFYIRDLFR